VEEHFTHENFDNKYIFTIDRQLTSIVNITQFRRLTRDKYSKTQKLFEYDINDQYYKSQDGTIKFRAKKGHKFENNQKIIYFDCF